MLLITSFLLLIRLFHCQRTTVLDQKLKYLNEAMCTMQFMYVKTSTSSLSKCTGLYFKTCSHFEMLLILFSASHCVLHPHFIAKKVLDQRCSHFEMLLITKYCFMLLMLFSTIISCIDISLPKNYLRKD